MTLTAEDIKVIKEFNRNVNWLKNRERAAKTMVTAQILTKHTGWSKEELRRARLAGLVVYQRSSTGGYRYDLNSVDVKLFKENSHKQELV